MLIGYDRFKCVVEGKNEIDLVANRFVFDEVKEILFETDVLAFISSWLIEKRQPNMSVAALVGSFDDIVRSASVLTEGIEGGESTVEPPFYFCQHSRIKTFHFMNTF